MRINKFLSRWVGQSRLFFTIAIVAVVLTVSGVFYENKVDTVNAGTSHNVSGWAWSDNIGWISFNSLNSTPGPDYGVNVIGGDPGSSGPLNGLMNGYAWSEHIGWISFGCAIGGECFSPDESAFPQGAGTLSDRAQINGNQVRGWARACAIFASDCKGQLKSDDALGGWDGWLSLSGTSDDGGGYGVVYNPTSKKFGSHSPGANHGGASDSFAWGDLNIGWVDFQPLDPSVHTQCADDPSLCGVILGRPNLGVSCIVDDNGDNSTPVSATWVANPHGGTGSYTYEWEGIYSNATCDPDFPSGASSVNNTVSTTCNSVNADGAVNAQVTITDTSGASIQSERCTNVKGGTGISILKPEKGYFITVTPNSLSALFQGGDVATTSPVANVRVLPFGPNPPFPAFTGDVTLLKESIDPQLLTDIGLTTDDILFQFSSQITGDPVTWGYDNSIQPMETVNNSGTSNSSYATVSLQVYLKRHPIRSGSFSIQIRGESDDGKVANATLTINVDKGTAGVKEQ